MYFSKETIINSNFTGDDLDALHRVLDILEELSVHLEGMDDGVYSKQEAHLDFGAVDIAMDVINLLVSSDGFKS